MSWKVLSEESTKQKREKKRKRKIKRGSKRGRYVVLGSRGRKGRKSAVRCVTCGRTLGSNYDGLVCDVCGKGTEQKVKAHSAVQLQHSMEIPEMSEK